MFFRDTTDFKKIINVNANFDFELLRNCLEDIDATLLKNDFLGEEFLAELQAAFDAAHENIDAVAEPNKAAILLVRKCSAFFGFVKWMPMGQVKISQNGILIASLENQKQAWQWQIKDIEKNVLELGYNALDELLIFLEKNLEDYGTYAASDQYKSNTDLFISSAKEFSKFFSLFKNSPVNFQKIRSVIKTVEEFDIQATILPDYYADLKSKIAAGETLGSNAKKIIELIKPALAHLAISRAGDMLAIGLNADGLVVFDNTGGSLTSEAKKQVEDPKLGRMIESAQRTGEAYLEKLENYLQSHLQDYPLYANDSQFEAEEDETDLNENEDGEQTYFAGF